MAVDNIEGELDLGPVQLKEGRILASGSVVDSEGMRVPHPSIFVWEAKGFTPPRVHADVSTTVDGLFSIVGFTDADLVLGVSTREQGSTSARVANGASDVILKLEPSGRVQGRLVLDDGVAPSQLHLVFSGETGNRDLSLFKDYFDWDGIAPGQYDMEVRTTDTEWLVAEVKEIVADLAQTEAQADPRLDPLDLRGLLVAVNVTLLDSSGRAAGNARIRVRNAAGQGGIVQTDKEGLLRLVLPTASEGPFTVEHASLGSTIVRFGDDGRTIRLNDN